MFAIGFNRLHEYRFGQFFSYFLHDLRRFVNVVTLDYKLIAPNSVDISREVFRQMRTWKHSGFSVHWEVTFIEMESMRRGNKGDRVPFPAIRKFIRRIFLSMLVAGDRELFNLTLEFERHPPWKT